MNVEKQVVSAGDSTKTTSILAMIRNCPTIKARPWEFGDLLNDLQSLIDEEPNTYTNTRRATLCTARDYLKDFYETYGESGKGWISVNRKLPKPMEVVLVLYKNKKVGIDHMKYWGDPIFDPAQDIITHWMPIPKLPEEDFEA